MSRASRVRGTLDIENLSGLWREIENPKSNQLTSSNPG
jgi:hypothetical protein